MADTSVYDIILPAGFASDEFLTTDVVIELVLAGPAGPPGASGASVLTLTAGATLSGHRVVRVQSDGTVIYADNTHGTDVSSSLWLTLGAALAGDPVNVQTFGYVTEPSWSWTLAPIFLGTAGQLTQTPPTATGGAAFIEQVAYPDGPTALFFNPRTPIQF